MPDDKPESEEGVKEWLARRLGENLPPRPRPTGPRPAPRPDPPLTSPTPRRAVPRSADRPVRSSIVPRGERPRSAPVSVGPAPRPPFGGFVEAGRPTENEDTGELLDDDTSPSSKRQALFGETEFPADLPGDDEASTHGISLRSRSAQRFGDADPKDSRWGGGTVSEIEPFPTGMGHGATPPAPDAFTADERFPSPPQEVMTSGSFSTGGLMPVGNDLPELSLELSLEHSDEIDLPFAGESDSDPVTRRLPPTEDEERKTGELHLERFEVPSAGPYPTPTQEHSPPDGLLAASAVLEASETAKLPEGPSFPPVSGAATTAPRGVDAPSQPPPVMGLGAETAPRGVGSPPEPVASVPPPVQGTPAPPAGYAAPPPPFQSLASSGFQAPAPPDEFLFAEREPDTVVLPDENDPAPKRWSSTGIWIALGLVMGVVGFGLVVSLLVVWLWLLAR